MNIMVSRVVCAIVWLSVLFYMEIPRATCTVKIPLRMKSEDSDGRNDLSKYPQMVKGIISVPGSQPEFVYISNITKTKIIHVQKEYHDVLISKNYKSKTAIMIVVSKDADDDDNTIRHCEEWAMMDEEFIQPYLYLNTSIDKERTGFDVTANFTVIHSMPNIGYGSCNDFDYNIETDEELESRSKRQVMKTYGNWCGRWSSPPWSNCCPSCENHIPCVAANCTPIKDPIDRACARMTFCRQCWQNTPSNALPHCDCVRDFVRDLMAARCESLLPGVCYDYRGSAINFMSSKKCWGRLSFQVIERYHCGYKQTNCKGTVCSIQPQMCFKKTIKITNNFQCMNFFTCNEIVRSTG